MSTFTTIKKHFRVDRSRQIHQSKPRNVNKSRKIGIGKIILKEKNLKNDSSNYAILDSK